MVLALLVFIGLGVVNTAYLYWQLWQYKQYGREMFCLIGGDCGEVVGSKYGKTLGIENEILGLLYYFGILVLLVMSLWFPSFSIVRLIMVIASVMAAAFSTYLLILQQFILHKYCSWCLFAIAINYVLLVLSYNYLFS